MARRKTERVSVATGGTQVNGFSSAPFVTADGRLVVSLERRDERRRWRHERQGRRLPCTIARR